MAASIFKRKGYKVTIIEKGHKVNGLYQSIKTRFGPQELGMHVLYVNDEVRSIFSEIFDSKCFNVLEGVNVDKGSSFYKRK